jgi:hypothetical protein
MAQPTVSEAEFIAIWNKHQSASKVASVIGTTERSVLSRRERIEKARGVMLNAIDPRGSNRLARSQTKPSRLTTTIQDGTVIVGSDVHLWPGDLTAGQRAFLDVCRKLKPSMIVMNGDVFDGAKISRHPTGIWEQQARPNVRQELEACQDYMGKIVKACPGATKVWTWGNHDARYEYRLSALAPEYEGVPGFALKDHFPEWQMGMSLWVNDDVVIKHRSSHSGIHATYNNTLKGGKSIVTGHLHSLAVRPWTDWNGTRYGVDTGTLADPDHSQFDYTEDNPLNWRSGLAVLTFRNGRMLFPELVHVVGDSYEFRGEVVTV